MNKHRLVLLFSSILVAISAHSQLKVNSQGNTRLDGALSLSEGEEKGLLLDSDSRVYARNSNTYFMRGTGGMKIGVLGKIKMMSSLHAPSLLQDTVDYDYDSPYINVDPWNYDATLFIRSNGSRPLHTSLFDKLEGSPREGIRSDVYMYNDKPFVAYRCMKPYSSMVFSVSGGGLVYANEGLTQTSDGRMKESVKTLTSASDKLNALRGVSFRYKSSSRMSGTVLAANEVGECVSEEVKAQIMAEQQLDRIGLVAQEVEEIVPEVVRTLPDGIKTIMYTDLIPLLIENIKELNKTVEEQQERIAALENGQSPKIEQPKKTLDGALQKESCVLYQNNPNPFNQETTIAYHISDTNSASICIYNMAGRQLKKVALSDMDGKVLISASEFAAGTYVYSLMVDNRTVDSKVMVLTD